MKALYRKYRPTRLKEVVGQEQVIKPLESALKTGKISHAYILIGPRGCGKTSVARIFAHEINKFPYEIEDNYPDIIEIDAASNTGVDNIRELKERAVIAPTEGKYKVYIIDEVHMLSKPAFNALLKLLEEPPKHVIFIMATTDAYKIPPTITSRAQIYNFNLATPDVMKAHLQKIIKKEHLNITDEALDVLVARGGGSFRDSLSLLDQIATLSEQKITKEIVIEVLGLPEGTILNELLEAYTQGEVAKITELLRKTLDNGTKPEAVAENLINLIIKDPQPGHLPLLEKLPEVAAPFAEAKLLLAFLGKMAVLPNFKTQDAPSNVIKIPRGDNELSESATISVRQEIPKEQPAEQLIEQPAVTPEVSATSFNKDSYVETVRDKSFTVADSLARTQCQLDGDLLVILAPNPFNLKILTADNNLQILKECVPKGVNIEVTTDKTRIKKDAKTSKLSDIMGAVQEVNLDGNPFGE